MPLSASSGQHGSAAGEVPHPAEIGLDLDAPPIDLARSVEDWRLDHNVRSMRARMEPWQRPRESHEAESGPSRQPQWRVDAAHASLPQRHYPKRRAPARNGQRSPTTFTNSALLLGLLAGAGGAGVLAYAAAEARGDLWNIGLSALVAGAVVFLLGLVLQLERIWHNSRFAVRKLRQIDTHLQDLERTTASLGVTHSSASQAFYSHMADQANPHLLLSDLKGQLDLLAMNFARR